MFNLKTICLLILLSCFLACDVGNSSNTSDVSSESNFNPQDTTLDCNFVCVVDADGEIVQVEKTCSGTGPDLVENLEAFSASDCNSFVEAG